MCLRDDEIAHTEEKSDHRKFQSRHTREEEPTEKKHREPLLHQNNSAPKAQVVEAISPSKTIIHFY